MLTREELLSRSGLDVSTLPREEVPLPSGGSVLVRRMTGAELDGWEQEMIAQRKEFGGRVPNVRAILNTRCLCDGNGARLFTDGETELVGLFQAPDTSAIYDVCCELNRLQRKKEDIEKN